MKIFNEKIQETSLNNLVNLVLVIIPMAGIFTMGGCNNSKPKVEAIQANQDTVTFNQESQANSLNSTTYYNTIHDQVMSKSEKKINDYSYHKVSTINVEINEKYATASCPVKKKTWYTDNLGILRESVNDKVYTLQIYYKKYDEFEIIKVELWDEGNMTKEILE